MRRVSARIAFVAIALAAHATRAGDCVEDPNAGPCFGVHGRMAAGNGNSGVRIWIVGTKKMLAVYPDDPAPVTPVCLRDDIAGEKRLYADFVVCPLAPERAGATRPVCVQSAAHRIVEEPGGDARAVAGVCTGP